MSVPRRPRLRPANPWGEELAPEVSAVQRPSGRGLRPLSAPGGGEVAICPHCWGVNPGAQRLCGRCGADMTLLLQESGGLRRTPAVQSPVPVRVSRRLGVVARGVLLVMTAVLALAWLIAPLLGGTGARARMPRPMAGGRDGGSRPTPCPGESELRRSRRVQSAAPEDARPAISPSRNPAICRAAANARPVHRDW